MQHARLWFFSLLDLNVFVKLLSEPASLILHIGTAVVISVLCYEELSVIYSSAHLNRKLWSLVVGGTCPAHFCMVFYSPHCGRIKGYGKRIPWSLARANSPATTSNWCNICAKQFVTSSMENRELNMEDVLQPFRNSTRVTFIKGTKKWYFPKL